MASSELHHGTRTIFYGPVVNPVSLTSYSTLPHCLLSIDPSGKIEWMMDNVAKQQIQETLASKKLIDVDIVYLKDGEFLIPGFIDTHTVYTLSF
jgi:guanine deaminase